MTNHQSDGPTAHTPIQWSPPATGRERRSAVPSQRSDAPAGGTAPIDTRPVIRVPRNLNARCREYLKARRAGNEQAVAEILSRPFEQGAVR
jgi:hypothetical protein